MKRKLCKSITTTSLVLICGLAASIASAQSVTAGFLNAAAPTYDAGSQVITTVANGEIWSVIGATCYYKVSLTVDGQLVWRNSNSLLGVGFGGWPGLTFDYGLHITHPLAKGTHTLIWVGVVSPRAAGSNGPNVGEFSFVTTVIVP